MAAVPSFEPTDAASAAAMLAHAAAERMRLVPRGHGTKLVVPADVDGAAYVSTARLTSGLAHYAGDLVATAPAGCSLREVNEALRAERQWIALDPPHGDRATIGGIVATNDSGPRRHGYGAPRDLVIGIEVALTRGTVAHGGGRVVKNVAGYDLGRLFCGSRGSLGLITSVTFKLAPVAPASRTVVASFLRPQQALSAAMSLSRSPQLTPTAVELIVPDTRLLIRFETTERSAELMAASAIALLSPDSTDVRILHGAAEAAEWEAHQQLESSGDALTLAVAMLPMLGATLFDAVEHASATCDVGWRATGRAALGVFRVHLSGSASNVIRAAALIGEAARGSGGHAQRVGGTAWAEAGAGAFGPLGTPAAVAAAVKQQFDPAGILPWPWEIAGGTSAARPDQSSRVAAGQGQTGVRT